MRVGKYGPYLEQGERRIGVPDAMAPEDLTLEKALELLEQGQQDDVPLGHCPDTGKPIYVRVGRFGTYIQLGESADPDRKNASLLKGMEPSELTLDLALRLLALPRTLGTHPESSEPIVASNGRYGPYIKCGSETRSLPADVSPLDVTLAQALELLAQPKQRGRGRATAQKPIREFPVSPVTEKPVKLLDGRYGPYVTDGTTNASLPKDADPEQVTFELALQLLADRAARAPSKRTRKATKKSATKKTVKKGTTKKTKKTATKKTATKKTGTKKATRTKKSP